MSAVGFFELDTCKHGYLRRTFFPSCGGYAAVGFCLSTYCELYEMLPPQVLRRQKLTTCRMVF